MMDERSFGETVKARRWGVATLAAFIAAGACNSSKQIASDAGSPSPDTGSPSPDADSYPDTPLGRVAAIVIPNCAIAGCHDAISKTHSQDLSSLEKIISNWVNVTGYDHCTGLDTLRVIPGDPDGSLVVMKIEGRAVCLQSNRMPLPPRDALTAEQIGVIRAWIAAGAPSDLPPSDGGDGDGGPFDAGDDAATDGGEGAGCTTTSPCATGLTCSGDACSEAWQCVVHFDETVEHPCDPATMLYCGCDGVTFEASITCPDRPFAHPGACGDGESCFTQAIRCVEPPPVCPEGQAPSVVDDCYGSCIPVTSCRCLAPYHCPNETTCIGDARCGQRPPTDAGPDSGTDDAGL
jgi:hypothetical protein